MKQANSSIERTLNSWSREAAAGLEKETLSRKRAAENHANCAKQVVDQTRARLRKLLDFDPACLKLDTVGLKLDGDAMIALSSAQEVPLMVRSERQIIETRRWTTQTWDPDATSITDSRGDWRRESGETSSRVGAEYHVTLLKGAKLGSVDFETKGACAGINHGQLFAVLNRKGELVYGITYEEAAVDDGEYERPARSVGIIVGALPALVAWLAEHSR